MKSSKVDGILVTGVMTETPLAFVTFNRPDSAARSFESIRRARPKTLFLVSDAARPDREGEDELVRRTRSIGEQVDWPCDVHRLYADENLGCARRISSAITAALELVDRLIILEDDCIAHQDFYGYCDNLLERYADDERVMAVSGNNFQRGHVRGDASYYFSAYPHCWGWATWRRAWQHFDLQLSEWPDFRDEGNLKNFCGGSEQLAYWTHTFDDCHAGRIDSWAYPWTCCCWMNHGLTALPNVNLVSNIGFNEAATHTRRKSACSELTTASLGPITHPPHVARHFQADQFSEETLFSGATRGGIIKRLRRKLGITTQRRAA
ncbi:MAG: glycosyltransferase family 2 protein [Planctomycetota bacterium]